MTFESSYNLRSPGVKRIMREAIEFTNATSEYHASPLDDNLFEWHFTVRGPPNTEFEEGYYHGRIILPTQYPMQPPNIILLTPNGRFEINKKICLSISGYHPETWQPSWSIRTALLALIAFMPTPAAGSIGSLDYTTEERKLLAKKSIDWTCDVCGKISEKLNCVQNTETSGINDEITECLEEPSISIHDLDDTINVNEVISSQVRQRTFSHSQLPHIEQENIVLLQTTRAMVWTWTMWIILFLICFLIIRRLFFL